ncbi:NBR1 homolog [Olea europaea subsp. europaea]|uniref:NBR1 homolog n=1 Tax=Olea europaea subsp. europaea TaxID=158383 RepID=A0A8S0R5P2_OLEEU|nr:NBR1 homolog [Olea europaea subsp. europaea]
MDSHVRYGDTLRRFIAKIIGEGLNFNMDGLRRQIFFLFDFPADTLLTLTYVDEDGDEVALIDDDDLRDVVRQALNPLRITVKCAPSSGSFPPLSPVQTPFQNLNPNIFEILKTVPEPLQETVKKLLTELASKVSSSVPGIAELVDHFSEMGLSYLDHLSDSQPVVQSNAQNEFRESTTDTKLWNSSEFFPSTSNVPSIRPDERSLKSHENLAKYIPETTSEISEVKLGTVKGGSMEASSSKAVNVDVDNPCVDSLCESLGLDPKPSDVPVSSFSQEKFFTGTSSSDSSETHFIPSNYSQKVLNSGLYCLRSKNAKLGAPTSYPAHTPWNDPDGSLKYLSNDDIWMDPSPVDEISFSAVPAGNDSAIPSHSDSQRRSISQNDGTGSIFHWGIRCDGCGVYPITGPRFKSKVKEDYDLCRICFAEMENDADYIRMDHPMPYQRPLPSKGLHGRHARARAATLPQAIMGFKVKPVAPKFDSRFIQDVNIIDDTVMAPLTPFTKIWRMRNNGTVVWPPRTQLVWIGGDKLNNALAIDVEVPAAGLPVEQELDVAVDFIAPKIPGQYISYWRMALPTGQKFGQRIWVLIQVDASIKETPHESVRDLNLNLPPPSNDLTGPEIINLDLKPMVEDSHPEPINSNDTMEVGESIVDAQPGNEHEKRFPINDSLLVGSGAASNFVPSAPPSFLPYPIIDLSEVAPPLPSQAPPAPVVLPLLANPPQLVSEKNEVEEKLLGELEAMGFTLVDLNKEILRKNDYDLQKTVDDLCGVSEWNTILEELREMGFHDTELNKKLLKKNDGSITLVVMDLIDGEEQ